MPCYGETVCKLCKCGISESLQDFQRPGVSVPPSRRDVGHQSASDLPSWIYEGTMYIGSDSDTETDTEADTDTDTKSNTEHGVRCLVKSRDGLMGRWIGVDGKPYDYNHVHWRCWNMAQERKDDILKATNAPTLAKGLMRLISAFGLEGACPEDPSYVPDSDVLQTWKNGIGCYNVISHQVTKAILPFATYSRYMGQACDWVGFLSDGHKPPSDNDVRHLITLMLTLRDWKVGTVYDAHHDSWECVFCHERRTKDECAIMDQRYHGPKHRVDSNDIKRQVLAALGEEAVEYPNLNIDDYVTDDGDNDAFEKGMARYKEDQETLYNAWDNQNERIQAHPLYKQLWDDIDAKEEIYQEIEARLQIESVKRHDAWLDLCRRKRAGEHVKASDIPNVYESNY